MTDTTETTEAEKCGETTTQEPRKTYIPGFGHDRLLPLYTSIHVGRLCPGWYRDKLPMDGAPAGRHDQLPEKVTSVLPHVTMTAKGDGEI